jgi:acetyl esterase/lipase
VYDVAVTPDLTYAEVDGQPLLADLYRPKTEQAPPLVIYAHGGGFVRGSRSDNGDNRLAALAAHGVAVLSVDYRLAPSVHFPAPLHDLKAAVRWIRACGPGLDVSAERVGLWGASAGSLLATLVGLTHGQAALEGDVGTHLDQSSAVQAVVAWFGSSDLLAAASRSWLEAKLLPFDFEAALLGLESNADVGRDADRARQASPLTWVTADAPPFLIAHGDRDKMVLAAQSQALHDALVRVGAQSSLLLVGGAGHEDPAFESPSNLALTAGFLSAALRTP